jgi:hypothetical protein
MEIIFEKVENFRAFSFHRRRNLFGLMEVNLKKETQTQAMMRANY